MKLVADQNSRIKIGTCAGMLSSCYVFSNYYAIYHGNCDFDCLLYHSASLNFLFIKKILIIVCILKTVKLLVHLCVDNISKFETESYY